MGLRAEWEAGTALKKPYPGAPNLPVTVGSNMGNKGQEAQAKIPQFFNFIGSSAGNVHAATEVPVTKSAGSPMKEKSSLNSAPDHPNKPGWLDWSELEEGRYKTKETLDKGESARLISIIEEESSTVSPEEAARIRAEVQAVMKQ